MAIFSPARYPPPPSFRVCLKLPNRACHLSLSVLSPVSERRLPDTMASTMRGSVLASSHQLPVLPSQEATLGSWAHATLPGWIPFPTPIGALAGSEGVLKGGSSVVFRSGPAVIPGRGGCGDYCGRGKAGPAAANAATAACSILRRVGWQLILSP